MPKSSINIAEHYQGVIKALLPFAARGKLREGLNKFTSRIGKEHLEEIQYEVNRLVSQCEKSASNKTFARGSVSVVKVNGVKVELDELGKRILKEELQTYNNTYSQGVYEALSSEQRYKDQISKENHKRKVEAFSVDCLGGNQQPDLKTIKVVPDFTISAETFDSGRHQSVHFLGVEEMALHLGYKPKLYGGETFDFVFPPLMSVTFQSTKVEYTCKGVETLPGRNNFAVKFKISEDTQWRKNVAKYIRLNASTMCLVADQEEQRTRENLLKDAVVSNMPGQALLCKTHNNHLIPCFALAPGAGQHPQNLGSMSLCKSVLRRLSKEFKRSREVFQLQCTEQFNGNHLRYVASLRELCSKNQLADFIAKGKQNNSLRVIKLELVSIDDEIVAKNLEYIDRSVLYGNEDYRFIIYATDVTHELRDFIVTVKPKSSKLPAKLAETSRKHHVEVCLPEFCDRRREPRYEFNTKAQVKAGWLKTTDATVLDISREGLRVRLDEPLAKVKDQVSVKIPSLNLSNLRYSIAGYDPVGLELRLSMTAGSVEKKAELFDRIHAHNFDFFDQRCSQSKQQRIFSYMWQLVSMSIPGVHIFLAPGKEAYQQLVVAQADGKGKTLAPFKMSGNRLTTHGWFANSDEASLCSDKLTAYTKQTVKNDRALFYINHSDKNYTSVAQGTFSEQQKRKKLYEAIKTKKGTMVVHGMQANEYSKLDSSWYDKRCRHLNKVDKLAISRIKRQEQECVCLLSITPVSNLHQNLLLVGAFAAQRAGNAQTVNA